MPTIETHPFDPVLPPYATVAMMGTLPPPSNRWSMAFHYPNFSNDMWRVFGLVFFDNTQYFECTGERTFEVDKIKDFLWEKGIAIIPSVKRAIREQNNASDKFLTVIETVNLPEMLAKLPQCCWIFTTGGLATKTVLSDQRAIPKIGYSTSLLIDGREIIVYRMPSTSRAYPLALIKKAEVYRRFFHTVGLI